MGITTARLVKRGIEMLDMNLPAKGMSGGKGKPSGETTQGHKSALPMWVIREAVHLAPGRDRSGVGITQRKEGVSRHL